jgi:hypothetical protein
VVVGVKWCKGEPENRPKKKGNRALKCIVFFHTKNKDMDKLIHSIVGEEASSITYDQFLKEMGKSLGFCSEE